jgi:hypothetical protein
MDQLRKEVGDSKLRAYIDWGTNQIEKAGPPPVIRKSSRIVLRTLLDADLSHIPTAYEACNAIRFGRIADFPLTKDTERSFVVTPHLHALDEDAYRGAYDRNKTYTYDDDAKEPPSTTGEAPKYHPCFVALEEPTRGPARPAPAGPSKRVALPKIVLPLGEVKVKDLRSGDKQMPGLPPYKDTGYVAVIDVVDPAKGVWLIFNRHPATEEGEYIYLTADQEDPLLPTLEAFETARLLPNLKDWVQGKLRMADMEKSLADTASPVALTPKAVQQDVVKAAFGARDGVHGGSSARALTLR